MLSGNKEVLLKYFIFSYVLVVVTLLRPNCKIPVSERSCARMQNMVFGWRQNMWGDSTSSLILCLPTFSKHKEREPK